MPGVTQGYIRVNSDSDVQIFDKRKCLRKQNEMPRTRDDRYSESLLYSRGQRSFSIYAHTRANPKRSLTATAPYKVSQAESILISTEENPYSLKHRLAS